MRKQFGKWFAPGLLSVLLLIHCSTPQPVQQSGDPEAGTAVESPAAESPAPESRGGQLSERVALIVAVGQYSSSTGWNGLSSGRDVPLIRSALLQQGFQESNIKVISDEEATKAGIQQAIRAFLIDRAMPGGVAVFHYSGHGQQIVDADGDETDGLDEALVPFDSPRDYQPDGYQGENLLRDEELGALLGDLRAKLGPNGNLLVILDSCHSGTGTRGNDTNARGTTAIMGSPEQLALVKTKLPEKTNALADENEDETRLAPMVAFFGASPDQLNFETKKTSDGQPVGSLSLAFSKVFSAAEKSTTYRALFDRIKLEMNVLAPAQDPQAEGQLDQEILGGKIVGQTPFFTVKNWVDPTTVKLQAGSLMGIFENTTFAFHPIGTADPDAPGLTPRATGKVVKADETSSLVQLDGELTREDALSSWIFVRERTYGDMQVQLQVNLPAGPLRQEITAALEQLPLVTLQESAALVLETDPENPDQIQLASLTNGETVIDAWSRSDDRQQLTEAINNRLVSYAQGQFMRALQLEDPDIDLRVELVPFRMANGQRQFFPISEKMNDSGIPSFAPGDQALLRISNQGRREAFFTLIDISPLNETFVVVPFEDESPNNYKILPGDTILIRDLEITIEPPFGKEVLKLIASREPLSLHTVFATQGQVSRGSLSPFEKLFASTYFKPQQEQSRGLRVQRVPPKSANIHSLLFEIRQESP